LGGSPGEDGFDEVFGFGAGDEDVWGDAEGEAVELLLAGEVLEGFVGGAAGDELLEGCELGWGEFGFGVGEEVGAGLVEDVGEEEFGVAAGVRRGQGGGGCGEGFAEGHVRYRVFSKMRK